MTTTSPSQTRVFTVDDLQKLNYYQRLGFSDASPTQIQIDLAYRSHMAKLAAHSHENSMEVQKRAECLLGEAHGCLTNARRRNEHDRDLRRRLARPKPATSPKLLLERYEVGRELFQGTRATIFSGRDLRLNREVIVKRAVDQIASDQEHRKAFQKEAELYAKLNSGNLVKILDYDLASSSIILEKMSHSALAVAKPNGLPHGQVQDIVEQALRGLEALHTQGMAHGRIDMSHLLVDDCNRIKLSATPGFNGISAALRPDSNTLHVAPEMLNSVVFGEAKVAVDIYAMGFLALELLVGKNLAKRVSPGIAFKGGDMQSWLLWHASATEYLPDLRELVPNISPAFASILERMTHKHQSDRFKDASECLNSFASLKVDDRTNYDEKKLEIESKDEIDLLGTPPQLDAVCQNNENLSWLDILRNPKVLLLPEGRKHLIYSGTCLILGMSMLVLAFSPSATRRSINDPWVTADLETNGLANSESQLPLPPEFRNLLPLSSPEPIEDPIESPPAIAPEKELNDPETDSHWQVKFEVPYGRIVAVDDVDAPVHGRWKLLPGEHRVLVQAGTDDERIVAVKLPEGSGEIVYFLDVPRETSEKSDPNAMPESNTLVSIEKTFHPARFAIPIVGAQSYEKSQSYASFLQMTFIRISRDPFNQAKHWGEFNMPSYPVDPRFSFALALMAHEKNDLIAAKSHCFRSLADSKRFNIAFMPTLHLLTRIQIERGESSSALSECRNMLRWLSDSEVRLEEKMVATSIDELAWWTGVLVGYCQSASSNRQSMSTDGDYTKGFFENLCSPEQIEKFNMGQRVVLQKANILKQKFDEYTKERQGVENDNRILRVARAEERLEEAKRDSDKNQRGSSNSRIRYESMDRSSSSYEPVLIQSLPEYREPHPADFRAYAPHDATVLADRALDSIVVGSSPRIVWGNDTLSRNTLAN